MLVTIGIPTYNAEWTLVDAIRSVFAQTLQDWELIIVDDGSTDRSVEIAQSINDPRVRVIPDGKNHGLEYRLNQIAALAKGRYIARMDADDIMHPERLARQVEYLEANPSIDLVGTATYVIDPKNELIGARHLEPLDTGLSSVLINGLVLHPTATGKAEWWRANPYDDSFSHAEDHELWCRTCENSKFARLQTPLYFYRECHKSPGPYMRIYKAHCRSKKRCFMIYGPRSIGWRRTAMEIWKINAKLALYGLATALGMQQVIINRRQCAEMNDMERERALDVLQTALGTQAPGLETLRKDRGLRI